MSDMSGAPLVRTVLKYGTEGLPFEFYSTPGFLGVLEGTDPEALVNPLTRIVETLEKPVNSAPLRELARGRKRACIVISDSTRPMPNRLVLLPILDVLEKSGIPHRSVVILIANGMHRLSTEQERLNLVGPDILRNYTVVDHRSREKDEMEEIGFIDGKARVLVNRFYIEADLKILTGFIEPHPWAGFSGGRKSILPGISGLETMEYMHGPEMIVHPACKYGVLKGNPFHEISIQVMERAGADFIVNMTLNRKKEITGVFSGHAVQAHLDGCEFLLKNCLYEFAGPLDFIVTTNSGAPLDCNLYQTVKAFSSAAAIVKDQGDIVVASRCSEGVGSPEFKEILEMVDSPASFVSRLMSGEFFIPDQWCAQEMYQIVTHRSLWVYTDGLSPDDLRRYHLHPISSITECVNKLLAKHGPAARWAVVPDGPMVILKITGWRAKQDISPSTNNLPRLH